MSTFRRTAVALAATMIAASTAALAYGTGPVAAASAVVQPTDNALAVAQAIAADPGVVVGAAWVARSHDPLEGDGPTGIVAAPVTGFPTAGQTAAILTTGDATIIDSPNDSGGSGAANSGPNVRGDTDYDVAILRIDLNVPAGVNCLSSFDFRYLSEEYPEYVNTTFNDAFIAELDPDDPWTTDSSDIIAPDNFAFDPANSEISINAAGVTSMTAGFAVGTTYDGATPRLRAKTPITPGPHSLYLSIFDQGDDILDSAVVVDNLGFGNVANPSVDCASGATTLDPVFDDDFVPFTPKRMLETRQDAGAVTFDHAFEKLGKAGAGSTTSFVVGGRGGVPVDAVGVTMNVTVVEPDAPGYVTVWPCGDDQPTASNLNYAGGQTVPNAVVTRVGVGGRVCVFTSAAAHLIADVNGFMPGTTTYVPQVPARLLDTRDGESTDDGIGEGGGPKAGGTVTHVQVGGRAGVPDDATAAVLNVTATGTGAFGYVTAFPCDGTQPTTSSLNYPPAATVPGLVIVKLSASGEVCLFTSATTHLIVDVDGYFPVGSGFTPILPERLLDSRGEGTGDGQFNGGGPYNAGQVVPVLVRGRAGVPAGASAAALNVIATQTGGPGYVAVFPCGTDVPNASSVNYSFAGATASNAVVSQIGNDGTVCLFTHAGAHLVVDITGYFVAD